MKAYKFLDSIRQEKKLSADGECNNNVINGKSNGQRSNASEKNDVNENVIGKNHLFKQQRADSPSNVPLSTDTDAKIGCGSHTAADSSSTKRHSIETFLSSTVPNVAENTRNGFAEAAAAAAAIQQYAAPFSFFTPYLKDMFLAAQLIRGKQTKNKRLVSCYLYIDIYRIFKGKSCAKRK